MDEENKIIYNEEALDDLIYQRHSETTTSQFKVSGWVRFYEICGLICCSIGIFLIATAITTANKAAIYGAFGFLCSALLAGLFCWFAAHVLRLQEKTAHHTENTSFNSEKNYVILKEIHKKLHD